jgi:ABC-type transporter MlaC component
VNRLLALSCLLLAVSAVGADDAAAGHTWLAGRIADYNALRGRLPAADLARHVVDESLDVDRFADHVLRNYVTKALGDFAAHLDDDEHRSYVAVARRRIVEALRQRLIDDLSGVMSAASVGSLTVTDADFDATRGTVTLSSDAAAASALEVRVRRREDGTWRIDDVEIDGRTLSRRYRDRFRETMDRRYSPAVLEAQLRQLDFVVLEDFTASVDGRLPFGWRWRDRDEDRNKPYRVHHDAGQTYLAAKDSGGSVILMRFAHWNPRRYPIMTWCWRADSLPPGGDERFGHTNDSAAGIYVFFSQTWIGMPRHIKYVWSSTLEKGTIGRRDRIARPYFVVVESGDRHLGEWLFASVDLEDHYDQTWGGRPKNRTQGLGLLTDANSTHSRAEAYYADLRVWTREAYEAGRVQDYCDCYRDLRLMTEADMGSGTAGAPLPSEMTP